MHYMHCLTGVHHSVQVLYAVVASALSICLQQNTSLYTPRVLDTIRINASDNRNDDKMCVTGMHVGTQSYMAV